jgi:uncharacterized protein
MEAAMACRGSFMSLLRLNISKLSEGVHTYRLETPPDDIGLDQRFDRQVRILATLEKTSRQLLLQVELKTGGLFCCDRCLDEFRMEIGNTYKIAYLPAGDATGGLEGFEVQFLHTDANVIDMGEDVRQYALLALPVKLLCKEECAGLCPVCGINKNRDLCEHTQEGYDPRWSVLKRFLEN